MLLPYWDRTGQVHYLEGCPESFRDWTRTFGEEVPVLVDHQGLCDGIQEILNYAVIHSSCRAVNMNIARFLELEY